MSSLKMNSDGGSGMGNGGLDITMTVRDIDR